MPSLKPNVISKNYLIIFYLSLLVVHVAHVFEEIYGGFLILNEVGLRLFLAVNWILFCIPVALFYFVLNDKRWAYKLSMIYAGFMAFQGISHNIATIITGRYFDGFAGGYTGIGLVTIGLPLIYVLAKTMPTTRKW